MKIYAINRIRPLIREHGHSINRDNIADFQDAIESDEDVKFKLEPGMWFHIDDASGRVFIHSNGSMGWSGRGTNVLAEIR